jgi:hypothetical protein
VVLGGSEDRLCSCSAELSARLGKGRQRELQRVQGEHVDGGGIELEAEHLAGDNDGARRADETTHVGSAQLAKKGGENEEA